MKIIFLILALWKFIELICFAAGMIVAWAIKDNFKGMRWPVLLAGILFSGCAHEPKKLTVLPPIQKPESNRVQLLDIMPHVTITEPIYLPLTHPAAINPNTRDWNSMTNCDSIWAATNKCNGLQFTK